MMTDTMAFTSRDTDMTDGWTVNAPRRICYRAMTTCVVRQKNDLYEHAACMTVRRLLADVGDTSELVAAALFHA